ncbi:MAG: acetolactate synthase, large subunit, biosynthetic type [Roseibacillus sp.]|jgi:acetolactate synthase-1/2/3 large subunit|nr:acetolactate synthase, large subunit, biosynthetic type [Roseibacillus sp.]MCP4730698.1 biosynthetic-type acetolactate synthase large subunit [Roseibacillus sp.]MDP7306096.1 biosynthetic-type acetolactate synthase large subunit [Roseibacillus sp.]HJM63279.1 biosynthetic-type acetolactate synthase large subunit [Roseibacillus sp.]|tara:strand:+ start:12673 stop:14400 length:1728 start_codon:yes stop_codon:yes gene_type:complete
MDNNKLDGAQALLKTLNELGIEYIFGYSGGAALPIFDALETVETKMKFILVRHEQGAVHMADGYARATGRPAAVLVTSGPGAGNTVSGLMTAQMDSVPMIVLTGQQVLWMLGKDAFQEADTFSITMPVVKHNFLVKDTNDLPRIAREAHHIATTGRPGPVLVDIPKNVSQDPFSGDLDPEVNLPGYHPERAFEIDEEAVESAVKLIHQSRRPIILAGQGCMIARAGDELLKLSRTLGCPVTTTLLGKGIYPETNDHALGMVGMHGTAYANKAIVEADLILNVGSRFDDRIIGQTEKFGANASIIHIDIDPAEMNKMISPDVQIIGDARAALVELNKRVDEIDTAEWLKHLTGLKKKYPLHYRKQGGLRMQQVIDELYNLTRGEAIISTDVGQHQMWAAQFYKCNAPYRWLSSGGAGTMGFGFPAAIGAQFACPDELVVAIVGDGGFQMTLFELATAALHKLPLKILVLNNHYLGMVRQWQELFFDDRKSGVDLEGNPDFVKLAAAYGIQGFNIKRPADVSRTLQKALDYKEGPCLIHAECYKTDNVFPMIPAGAPLEDMLIEPPKRKMAKPVGST